MKVYFYKPHEVGLEEFPPGLMRLPGFDVTEIPANADLFCLPAIMHHFSKEVLLNLKYLPGKEERHILWDCADDFRTFGVPWIAIRCATTKHILKADPTTIAWPWPVEPLARSRAQKIVGEPLPTEFRWDVSFWGWLTPLNLTARAGLSIQNENPYWAYLYFPMQGFFGYKSESDADYKTLREGFVRSLWESRLALCPASIDGVIRYRFMEQISMGRGLPVHICDNVVMPWADRIDWDGIVPKLNVDWAAVKGEGFDHTGLSCPEAMVDQVGPLIREWLDDPAHHDLTIKARATYAQRMFDQWLHRDKWDELFSIAVKERLEGKI